jgi:pentatricopeptide repeat protein
MNKIKKLFNHSIYKVFYSTEQGRIREEKIINLFTNKSYEKGLNEFVEYMGSSEKITQNQCKNLLKVCFQNFTIDETNKLFEKMKEKLKLNINIYNEFFNFLLSSNRSEDVEKIIKENVNLKPNSNTYSYLIDFFLSKNNIEKANYLKVEMQKNNLSPNIETLNNFISYYLRNDNFYEALDTYEYINSNDQRKIDIDSFKLIFEHYSKYPEKSDFQHIEGLKKSLLYLKEKEPNNLEKIEKIKEKIFNFEEIFKKNEEERLKFEAQDEFEMLTPLEEFEKIYQIRFDMALKKANKNNNSKDFSNFEDLEKDTSKKGARFNSIVEEFSNKLKEFEKKRNVN